MNTILVDTSVWINFFKGIDTRASVFLRDNMDQFVIATCPVIVQEVLQGVISDKQYTFLKNYFNGLAHLSGDSYLLANEAAQLYRQLRKAGITIRKPNDCLIAAYTLHHKVTLLHDDKDFDHISNHAQLNTL
ncbi:MAG: PIN domain-containing protein [Bacteroidota bacterium]